MIVHLVKEQKGSVVTAKCGAVGNPEAGRFALSFTGFDSRVTCVHCKPSLAAEERPGPKRRVRIRRTK